MRFVSWNRVNRLQLQYGFFLLVLTANLNGCATLHLEKLFSRSVKVPIVSSSIPSAQDLLSKLEARRQALTSLRGLARVVYKDTQDKGTAKQAIAVAAPDRFRWELFSPIGVAALITSDGIMLSTYFPSEKVLYRGAATSENVARFTRVFLSPREIVGLLLGAPVIPPTNDSCMVRLDTDNDWYQLSCFVTGQEGLTLWFEQPSLQLRRVEMRTADGKVMKHMDLADYRIVGGQPFPFEITLVDVQTQQQASILYERVELNPNPPDSIFTLASINGVREIDADAFNTQP